MLGRDPEVDDPDLTTAIDEHVARRDVAMDDGRPEKIDRLIALGQGDAVKKANLSAVETRFLNGTPAAKFAPLHTPSP